VSGESDEHPEARNNEARISETPIRLKPRDDLGLLASDNFKGDCLHGTDIDGIFNVVLTVIGDLFDVLDLAVVIEGEDVFCLKNTLAIVLATVHINGNLDHDCPFLGLLSVSHLLGRNVLAIKTVVGKPYEQRESDKRIGRSSNHVPPFDITGECANPRIAVIRGQPFTQ
jgi:hypothetical protein